MALLVILLSSLAVASAQSCSCETSNTQFTDQYFNCPLDNFCSESLVSSACGKVCHASGSFHSSPHDDTDVSNTYGSLNCAGSLFDSENYAAPLCAYSTPSNVISVLSSSNVPAFACSGCDSSKVKYFDYDSARFQVLCESGVIQYMYSDNTTEEFNGRLFLNKNTCVVSGGKDGSKTITSVSCKSKPNEIDACVVQGGSPSGITGHCHFGTCWLYCENNKQLSFQKYGTGARINIGNLPCENGFSQYGQAIASNLECN
ncbi:hypothetical protein PFISCL1PPCAC_18063 [Pristionchus fissidentatus]|uniref:Uncharacterized protein n=1 Tax=Pristionchus fissidentatus TaxID=1538716 RepID=A0AAV5W7J6_9BILA|nr:hypothetical protein PFISCL1PPCAC_18063 [Pristionchus fissidentatus]